MKIHLVFHVSLLEHYHASTIPRRICEPPPPIAIDGEQKYEVKDVFNLQISNDRLQYLIHWCAYDVSERIWELVNHSTNVVKKVKDFHQQYPSKPMAAPHGTRRDLSFF
jgi:hypothetical protein